MGFIERAQKNKKKMNRCRWNFDYIILPISMLLMSFFVAIYFLLIFKYNADKLIFGIIYIISLMSLIIYLVYSNSIIFKKELLLELDKHDLNYQMIETKKYYQLDLVDVNGTQEYITFMEKQLHMFGQTYNYEDLYFYVETNNDLKLVNLDLKVYFSDPNNPNSSFMLLVLNAELVKVLKQFSIKLENEEVLNYILENKEEAFKQILRYSKIKASQM